MVISNMVISDLLPSNPNTSLIDSMAIMYRFRVETFYVQYKYPIWLIIVPFVQL